MKREIIKYSQTEKSLEKSVDKGFTAWYNNKAVGREYETKGNQPIQKVSWKLNNALNNTLEDSLRFNSLELFKKSSRRQKNLQAKYSILEYRMR